MDPIQCDAGNGPIMGPGEDLYCADLPTRPRPELGRVLVTGGSGYIGGRLVPELLARGYQVRIMVRSFSPEYTLRWPGAEICVADVQDREPLRTALKDVAVAYYLIHSLILGPKEFASADIQAARNFCAIATEAKVRRIIYLGGLGDVRNKLSDHLQSRAQVAEELRKGPVPVTALRAAVIVGSGSASYEIIQHLVKRMRVLFIPSWAKNRCQPISVRDVIKYLVGVLEIDGTAGQSFDIGGPDVLTYEQMIKILAALQGKQVFFLPAPFSNIAFYAYATSLITPIPEPITKCLMESLVHEVFCLNNDIKKFLPFENISYRGAIVRALGREEQDRIYTRWSDAYPPAHELAIKLHELSRRPTFVVRYSLVTAKSAESLFDAVCRVGGKKGWFYGNWMWRLRGMLDRIMLGVGTARGRKNYGRLNINDVVDFWRVEDVRKNERLLLRAEMKLPGRAWLEFGIADQGGQRILTTMAYYDTTSLAGKAYWYACLPFHYFLFPNLIKQIESTATDKTGPDFLLPKGRKVLG